MIEEGLAAEVIGKPHVLARRDLVKVVRVERFGGGAGDRDSLAREERRERAVHLLRPFVHQRDLADAKIGSGAHDREHRRGGWKPHIGRHVRDHAVVRLDPDKDRQRHAVLHDDIDPAFHELIEIAVEWREDAFDVLARELLEAHPHHHQHDAGRRQPVEFIWRVVDHGSGLETADLEPGGESLEHRAPRCIVDGQ